MSRAHGSLAALVRRLALPFLALAIAGCEQPPPEDVDLGTLQLRLWQPQALATGSGDLLEDATRVELSLLVDGEEQKLTLDEELRAGEREAAATGSEVSATLRTVGGTLPDALARSGTVVLEPDGGDVTVTALLAPPDAVHALSLSLPNARDGMAVCASADGRVWAIGGLLGGTLAGGSFVIDHTKRAVREGPALAPRAFASCAADGEGGVYLAGGCSEDGTPTGTLDHSATGELGSSFAKVDDLPGAGCHTRVLRTGAGTFVVLHGSQLSRHDPESGELSTLTLPSAHFAGVLAAFPDDGERVLVSGGYSDEALTIPAPSSLIVDLADDGAPPGTLGRTFPVAVPVGDALVVVDGTNVSRLTADGQVEALHAGVVPGAFSTRDIAPLSDGRYALLRAEGGAVLVVGGDAPKTLPLAAPRERLWSDPGGALLLLGGATAGVSLIVVE